MANQDSAGKKNRPGVPGSDGFLSHAQLHKNQRRFLPYDAMAAWIESRPGGAEFLRRNYMDASDLAVMLSTVSQKAEDVRNMLKRMGRTNG